MQPYKIIFGYSEKEIINYIKSDFASDTMFEIYRAHIKHGDKNIYLDIKIDLGGGFESGFETTSLMCYLNLNANFSFTVRQQVLLDKIVDFLGNRNLKIGYSEFDKKVIVTTNDEARIRDIFENDKIRKIIQSFDSDFTLKLAKDKCSKNKDQYFLRLIIDEGLFDVKKLQKFYNVFLNLLASINDYD